MTSHQTRPTQMMLAALAAGILSACLMFLLIAFGSYTALRDVGFIVLFCPVVPFVAMALAYGNFYLLPVAVGYTVVFFALSFLNNIFRGNNYSFSDFLYFSFIFSVIYAVMAFAFNKIMIRTSVDKITGILSYPDLGKVLSDITLVMLVSVVTWFVVENISYISRYGFVRFMYQNAHALGGFGSLFVAIQGYVVLFGGTGFLAAHLSQSALRPGFRFADIRIDRWLSFLAVVGLIFTLLWRAFETPADYEHAAGSFGFSLFIATLLPAFLAGCALFHAMLAESFPAVRGKGILLLLMYLSMLLLPPLAGVMVAVGFVDSWCNFRRYARRIA